MQQFVMKNLSEILKANRALLNISQAEMSLKLGIQAVRYGYYESGKRNPKADFYKAYKEAFNIDLLNENVTNKTEISKPYHQQRHEKKLLSDKETLDFYEVGANAATEHTAEIIPIPKNEKTVLHINDLFKGSDYAIRISGNSMTPLYPSGAIIGIKWIEDKQIMPGSVYVIEKGNDLLIKRLFYKDDNQDSGQFECISDNTMKHESGHRAGKLCYPHFYIKIDEVRKLFKVTGIFKSNELILIN